MVNILEEDINKVWKSSKIKTFGFMLYTDESPNIVKLLRDDDNWKALNKISGEKFYIFAVKPKIGSESFPSYPKGVTGMMMKVWNEPEDNKALLSVLDIKSTQKLPLFFIFTKVDDHLLTQSIKIDEKSVDAAFIQLKELFYEINDVTENIHSEYEEHPAQVHDKIKSILDKHKAFNVISDLDNFYKTVKNYIPLLKYL